MSAVSGTKGGAATGTGTAARTAETIAVERAEAVAAALAYEFLKNGNYSASSGPVELPVGVSAAAAGVEDEMRAEFCNTPEFGGLAVQSVGFENGVEDPKIHIYLTRASARLAKSLPEKIEGVPLRAHRMGLVSVRPEAAASATNRGNFYERNGRVCCGSSCAPTSENCTGTLGALVAFEGSREIYLLSNNHVFAGCNHVPKNQPILAPSSNDGRPDISAPREIGRHDRIHELRSGSPMFVDPCDTDLALARATNPDILCSWQGAIDHGYDTPDRTVDPASLMRVKKYGRTTGLSRGQIEAKITTPTPITYNSKHFKGVVWFKDIWTVRAAAGSPFALPGDSGSLVVTEDGSAAVGLLFAANPTGEYGWIIPISAVLATFGGLRLLHGHGIA
jgi:hypothetical protein